MSDQNARLVIAAVLVAAAAWIATLAVANVRKRTSEIGLLRSLGYGSWSIGALVLGRAALIGVVAAAVGGALGTLAALMFGPQIFEVTARSIEPRWALVGYALLATPLFASAASLIPAAIAVAQDPAAVLRAQ